jgi:2-polyprenyl-3-methyl-5-hydroxy-6-metoxy-1,4-benzoquinol methylase
MIYRLIILVAKILGKISRELSKLASNFSSRDFQIKSVINATDYDMVSSPDEPYYLEQYWLAIAPHLINISSEAKILDLGCGQGRLSMRMALNFPNGIVDGCDLSPRAIKDAKKYANLYGLKNIKFEVENIKSFLGSKKNVDYDIILLTEVTFFYPEWPNDLKNIARVLKPGGILIISNRSLYFNALCIAKNRQLFQTNLLLEMREGCLFGGGSIFTWQTSKEIEQLIAEKLDFDILEMRGIGVCSGILGDPHDFCSPSLLDGDEMAQLMQLELELGLAVPDAGRYIMAIAKKPPKLA